MTWSKSNKWLWTLGAAFAVFALLSIILFTLGVGSLKITHSNSSWALMQLQMEQQKMQSALKLTAPVKPTLMNCTCAMK